MNLVVLPKHSRTDVALESLKSRIGRACLPQHFQENPAHALSTPQVHPFSHKLEWTNQKHLYCFCIETNQGRSCFRVSQSSSLPGRHAQKSSGVEIERMLACTYDAHAARHMKASAKKTEFTQKTSPAVVISG